MKPHILALGRMKSGKMNNTEAAYAQELELRKCAGEILWYRFEGITFKLADDTRYTPDFAVLLSDGTIEIHEVKGHWREDAWVKFKVVSEQYPFRFVVVKAVAKKRGGGFSAEVI